MTLAAVESTTARTCAVLSGACDGYPAGTTGEMLGRRQGCVVFAPDSHDGVARWAAPRRHLMVPEHMLVALD